MLFSQRISSWAINRYKNSGRVATGPFAGAPATEDAVAQTWNRLLGIYEFYLHPVLEDVIRSKPKVVVDVGASSGYYSVGLGFRLPESLHYAFEMDDKERASLERTATRINAKIEALGFCMPQNLIEIARSHDSGLLVMDCEGGEKQLLGDEIKNHLAKWTILLEVHDYHAPGAGEEIQKRFEPTHDIKEIWSRPPVASDFKFLLKWPLNIYCEKALQRMCEEGRNGSMRFFYMTPR